MGQCRARSPSPKADVVGLTGQGARAAISVGAFLGTRLDRLGRRSSRVVEASEADRNRCRRSARRSGLWSSTSAPPISPAARPAAEEEIALRICPYRPSQGDAGGGLHAKFRGWGASAEVFRTLAPSIGPKPIRAYAFLEVGGLRRIQ